MHVLHSMDLRRPAIRISNPAQETSGKGRATLIPKLSEILYHKVSVAKLLGRPTLFEVLETVTVEHRVTTQHTL